MKKELSFALHRSTPVFFGYLFLGIAFGLMLQRAGFSFPWAVMSSVFIYAGSGQFALVEMLQNSENLIAVAVMTFSINCRHIFYGISFIERFKAMGKRGLYMIFSLTDETYSLLCTTKVPEDCDEDKAFFYIAVLDQLYWVFGSLIGALIGQLITFNSEGIEFAMTALFVVLFIEQWLENRNHLPALIGAVCSIGFLLLVGPTRFILPSLLATVALLLLLRTGKPLGKGVAK